MNLFLNRWSMLFLICTLAACSPQSCSERVAEEALEEAIEAETGAEVDIDATGNQVTIRGPEGAELQVAGGEGAIELPDDFPANLPIYPDAVPVSFMRLGSEGIQAAFRTDATASAVQSWYAEQLTDLGGEIQMNTTTPEGGMLMVQLEGNALMVSISGDTGGAETAFVLHYQTER